jgi:hypothetical protein
MLFFFHGINSSLMTIFGWRKAMPSFYFWNGGRAEEFANEVAALVNAV